MRGMSFLDACHPKHLVHAGRETRSPTNAAHKDYFNKDRFVFLDNSMPCYSTILKCVTCAIFTYSEDGEMHITLQKREKGKTWSSPIQGQGLLDPYAADQEQKRLMLQRFQEENPGFDFSQAQFSGNCPDPRTFMGGIRLD
ncbi:hypothetical protein PR202_gb26039 [Eleusine coracana subsp. coracana]|uniref:NudC domain-containing protein 2 n=1 Tax=Eleusine coracana subsp. coracana TaxID=191504 RepID=A0AAV5FQH2_ELECO|nr:hypothetical protein PR202_gb26039 [Eleusine coracana subsp. coracana]